MLAQIVFGLVCFCFALYLLFCGIAYFRFAFGGKKVSTPKTNPPPASIVICARNEAVNIKKNLILFLEQDYPTFEVIVVDDCSWDSTPTVLKEMLNEFPRLKALFIKEDDVYKHGKKLAITIGIKSAQYEHLVFSDADCFPATKNWLAKMMEAFDENTEIVLGYGAYTNKKGLLNRMIRMDTFRIGLQYLSLAVAGAPYMGIGRNMAYRKSLFLKQKGFAPYSQIPSGDDDLFVNKAGTKYNTRIAASKECITFSEPKNKLGDWLRQKRRHISTAQYYRSSSKFTLGIITFYQYFFWLSSVALLFFIQYRYVASGIIGGYIIIQSIMQWQAMKRLGEKKLFIYSLLTEWLLLFFFYPLVAISNLLFKQVEWKT